MKPEEVIGICKGVIEPITEKLFAAIESLPSKEDIKKLISDIETKFTNELKDRDKTIYGLESRISDLETLRLSDTDKLINLNEKIAALEARFESTCTDTRGSDSDSDGATEKSELNLVVLGDSIVKYVNPDLNKDELDRLEENKLDSTRGGMIQDMYERAEEIHEQHTIHNLIIHVGSNHIPQHTPMSVSYGIIKLIDDIRDLMPETKIYFSAILPKENVRFNPGINEINRHIFNVSTMMNFEFIPHTSFCQRGIVNERLYGIHDRIHLSRAGTKQLESDFQGAINN